MTEDGADSRKDVKTSLRRKMDLKNRLAYMGILPEKWADTELEYNEFREIKKRFFRHKAAVVALSVIIIVIFIGIFADHIAPYDPLYDTDYSTRNYPPVGMTWSIMGEDVHGTWEHPLGTDDLGRDVLSRLLKGVQFSLLVGVSAVAIGLSLGIVLGLVAGFFMSWIDPVIMRFLDIIYAFPAIMLAAVLAAFVGKSVEMLILIIGVVFIPSFTRIVRGSMLSEKEKEYVMAARSIGVKRFNIIMRHIFPNILAPIVVIGTLRLASAILVESGLSFLGFGPGALVPTLGGMLADGRTMLHYYPTLCIFPGIIIMIIVLGWNMAGDGLRDAMDPSLREQ